MELSVHYGVSQPEAVPSAPPHPQYMHSSSSPRLFTCAGCALSLLLSLLPIVGCGGSSSGDAGTRTSAPSPSSAAATSAEQDSALALLSLLGQDAFEEAFGALPHYAYTRRTRTEQRSADRTLVAARERTVRYQTQDARRVRTVVAADSAGAFERGLLGRLASEDAAPSDPSDVAPYIIPEDPAYLSARNQEDFTYHLLPDTVIAGVRASVVEVRARPSSSQSLRRLRLYLDGRTPIAVHLERADQSLLYREQSRFELEMQPAPSGGWVPHRTDVRTRLKRLLRPAQRFITTSTYSDFEPSV